MIKRVVLLCCLLFSFGVSAEMVGVSNAVVKYEVRDSRYNSAFDKLNVEIEISLVDGRLPNKAELSAVSEAVLEKQPNAKMKWVEFYLPKMKSGAGAYATNHTAPNPEGVKILEFMLYNTPYKSLIK